MDKKEVEFKDSEIVDALNAVKDFKGKSVRLAKIHRPDDIYHPLATEREKIAFRLVWTKLFQMIDVRWSWTKKTRHLKRMYTRDLFVTPHDLLDQCISCMRSLKGREAGSYEELRTQLLEDISVKLMLQDFQSFKRIKSDRTTNVDLGVEFARWMYERFCYALKGLYSNLNMKLTYLNTPKKEELRMHKKIAQELFERGQTSLQDSLGPAYPDGGDPLTLEQLLDDGSSTPKFVEIPARDGEGDVPLISFTSVDEVKEFCNQFVLRLVGRKKQHELFLLHVKNWMGVLDLNPDEKVKECIMRKTGCSSSDYDVNMTRLRKELKLYIKSLGDEENQEGEI
jgi:hypothetical protein